MFCLTSENRETLEQVVIQAATLHDVHAPRHAGHWTRFFHLDNYYASYSDLCVKYNDDRDLDASHAMLQHLYALASEDGITAPHVPRPVHYFQNGPMRYMIMERVDHCAASDEELILTTAEVIKWLRSKRYPVEGPFGGPAGQSYVCHGVFNDGKSPHMFENIAAVEKYLNVAVGKVNKRARMDSMRIVDISLLHDEVVLTQSDMNPSNFGVAHDGRGIIYDTDTIRALPILFADMDLLRNTAFSNAVSHHVFSPDERVARLKSPVLESLVAVGKFLFMISKPTLGVDASGNQVGRQRLGIGRRHDAESQAVQTNSKEHLT